MGMQTTVDLGAAADEVARVVAGVRDDQLDNPTPCEGTSVAALLDHFVGLTLAFRHAAEKSPLPSRPSASAHELVPDWRTRLPAQLSALAEAWRAPSAWEGTAEAGGVEMPAPAMAAVALDELVVHGWDLAVATGQTYSVSDTDAQACMAFAGAVGESAEERLGLYGLRVPVPARGAGTGPAARAHGPRPGVAPVATRRRVDKRAGRRVDERTCRLRVSGGRLGR
jgi:uncharacterized protein (TIGR03086 family)